VHHCTVGVPDPTNAHAAPPLVVDGLEKLTVTTCAAIMAWLGPELQYSPPTPPTPTSAYELLNVTS
jgi:hypothetical protein